MLATRPQARLGVASEECDRDGRRRRLAPGIADPEPALGVASRKTEGFEQLAEDGAIGPERWQQTLEQVIELPASLIQVVAGVRDVDHLEPEPNAHGDGNNGSGATRGQRLVASERRSEPAEGRVDF